MSSNALGIAANWWFLSSSRIPYSASKFAVRGMMEALYIELRQVNQNHLKAKQVNQNLLKDKVRRLNGPPARIRGPWGL